MRKYYKILFGISLLLGLSGCQSSVTESVENKEVQMKEEEKEQADAEAKEKSAYQLLQEAIKKNQEWTSWGEEMKVENRSSDFNGYYEGPLEMKQTYYENCLVKDKAYYSVENWTDDYSPGFRILKITDADTVFISGHYSDNQQSPNAQFTYQKSESSKERYETAIHSISTISSLEDSNLFNSAITQENGKTVLSFTLKDSEKFHDYLVETQEGDGKKTLNSGVEIDKFSFDTYSWTYTINAEGYIESYEYELYQKFTDELEDWTRAEYRFFDIDSISMDTDYINQLIDSLPKDQAEGQMQGDFNMAINKPE